MSADVQVVASGCHLFSGCGYPAPSLDDFNFKPIFSIGVFHFTKPMALSIICAALVIWFFWAAFAKPKLVPRGVQNIAEMGVFFVRDQIGRSMMGKRADRFLPLLVAEFFFIWLMNLMEVIPIAQFPAMSRIAFPGAIVLVVWCTYMGLGFKNHGFFGYLKMLAVPQGAPWWILPLLVPIELASNIIVRPFTLTVRLFANMFACDMLLTTFTIATWYLLSPSIGAAFAVGSFAMTVVLTAFELLIQGLQAYIFTMLTAQYIGGAYESH